MSWIWNDRKSVGRKPSSYSILPAPPISRLILPRLSTNSIDDLSSRKTKIRSVQQWRADLVSQTNSSSLSSRSSLASSWSPDEPFTNDRSEFEFLETQIDSFSRPNSFPSLRALGIKIELRKEDSQAAVISTTPYCDTLMILGNHP
jgi:hypothetical protein